MSTVTAVKAALPQVFRDLHAADAEPVTVVYGPRSAKTVVQDRLVLVGRVTSARNEADSMSRDSETETYTVEVITSVDIPGAGDEGQQAATEAALALWTRQKDAVREFADGALGLEAAGVLGAWPAPEFEVAEAASDTGRAAAVRWGVYVIGQRT